MWEDREAGRGLLMIGPHATLSKLVVRYLCDQEYAPIIVVADLLRAVFICSPPGIAQPAFSLDT
jgi:hypothetical protein